MNQGHNMWKSRDGICGICGICGG